MSQLVDHLQHFVAEVEAMCADGADDQALDRLTEAVANAVKAICASRGAQWERYTPSFKGVRAAFRDLALDLPECLPDICQGLLFAADVLIDALDQQGASILSAEGNPDLSSYQLGEPEGAGGFVQSVRLVSRLQCVQVVAAAFFGVIDRREWGKRKWDDPAHDMPEFSCFALWEYDCDRWKTKNFVLMGVAIYFHLARSLGKGALSTESVTITRKAIGPPTVLGDSYFCPVEFHDNGVLIHSFTGPEILQADFANEYLGGGVMRGGGSQEEELFLCCPELLATIFLVEKMLPFEAVEIAGARKYVDHSMASARRTSRKEQFCRPMGESDRCTLTTVAMDAICFNAYGKVSKANQYEPSHVRREVHKCLAALRPPSEAGELAKRTFVTGLWGCGAFRGDPELKVIIQWICCSLEDSVERMSFCPFDMRDKLAQEGLTELIGLLPGRVKARSVLDLLVEDPDYSRSSSTFGYLLEKLGAATAV